MYADTGFTKTPATLDEIWTRVYYALARHPLCRDITFDVVRTPRNARGSNWTVSMQFVASGSIWEASDIVADIQDAYELAAEPSVAEPFAYAA